MKITGRGRHVAVDTEGWLLALVVSAASVSDKAGAKILLIRLFDASSTLRIMWAETGYNGRPLARYARDYERTTANSEAMIYWATVIIMTRRKVVAFYGDRYPASGR